MTVDRNQNEYKLDGFHDNKKYELQIYGNNAAGDGPIAVAKINHSQKISRLTERMRKPIEIKKLFAIPMPGNSIKVIWQLRRVFKMMLVSWRCQPIKSQLGNCEPIRDSV